MADGSPGGKTVGGVNIRVVPDTSKFKRDIAALIAWFNGKKLKLEIEADTAKIRGELEELTRDRKVTLKVHADTAAARAAVRRMESTRGTIRVGVDVDRAAAAAARREVGRDIDVKLDPKINEAQIAAAFKFLERDLKVHVDPKLDTLGFEAKLEAMTRAREMLVQIRGDAVDAIAKIEAIRRTKVEVRAHIDATRAHQQIQALTRARRIQLHADLDDARARMRLAALTGRNNQQQAYIQANLDAARARLGLRDLERGRDVPIRPELNHARVAAVAARLAWLTHRREILITTNIRNNFIYAAARSINALWRAGTQAFKVVGGLLQGAVGLAAGLAGGMLKVGASMTSAAAEGTGAFASMMAKISGSMAGMADSATSFASKMGGAFVQAMSNLPQLILTLVTLTATIGFVSFAAGALIGVISALAAALLSLISAAVGIVGLLGAMAIAMASAGIAALALAAVPLMPMVGALGLLLLNSDRFASKLKEIKSVLERHVAPAAKNMYKAFDGALSGISKWLVRIGPQLQKFFDAGSKFVQPLVDSLTGFVDQILPRVTNALKDSGMVAFASALKDTFIGLGRTFGDFIQILASNGEKFGGVIREMGRGIDVVVLAVGRFMVQMSNGATSLGKLADGVGAFFDELGVRMGRALDSRGFDDFMTHVQTGIRLLGEGVGRWVEEAARHGKTFGVAFERIAQAFSDSAEPMARFMAAGARVLPTVLDGIGAAMGKVMPALEEFMVVWANASPEIMSAIADVIAEILTNLSDGAVVEGIKRMVEVMGNLITEFTKPEMFTALVGLGEAFAELAQAIGPGLIDGLTRFVDLLTPLGSGMAAASQFMTGDLPGAMDSLGSAWGWLKDKFTSDNQEVAVATEGMFSSMREGATTTATAIAEQAAAAYARVAADHGQMKNGVLTDWADIDAYTKLVNDGIGSASENAQTRVDAAASEAKAAWERSNQVSADSSATMAEKMSASNAAAVASIKSQAESQAAKVIQESGRAKDGVSKNLDGTKESAKTAYDNMSESSRKTWDKMVNDAQTGSTNMNVTSVQAWNDLAKKIESTLKTAEQRIQSHSKGASKQLGAIPKEAGDKWPALGTKVTAEANRCATAVRNAATQMRNALTAVTNQTYTINVKVNTTKTVTEIQRTASEARASAQMAPPILYAAPPMFNAGEFRESLPDSSYSSYRAGGGLSSAINSGSDARSSSGEPVTQNHVTVNANTNADPTAISREVAWQLKRITR